MRKSLATMSLFCGLLFCGRPVGADGLVSRVKNTIQADPAPQPPPRPVQESFVKLPTRLADVRAMGQQPGLRITEAQERHDSVSGGPCHSAACLIYLPLLFIPSSYRTVLTITRDGQPYYVARFDGERFLSAERTDGAQRTQILSLSLAALGREVIVTTHSSAAGRTPIQPQVDLRTVYQAAIRSATRSDAKYQLLEEAVRVLQDEAIPLLLPAEQLAVLSEEQKAYLIRSMCLWADRAARIRVLQALPLQKSVGLTVGALDGSRDVHPPLPAPLRDSIHQRMIRGLCGTEVETILTSLVEVQRGSGLGRSDLAWQNSLELAARLDGFVPQLDACPLARRAGVRVLYRQPPSSPEIRASLAAGDALAFLLQDTWRSPEDALQHRADFIAALASPTSPYDRLLRQLERIPQPVQSGDEFLELAKGYAASTVPTHRAVILYAFSASNLALARSARDWLRARSAAARAAQAPAIDLALVVLGQRERALSAARGFGPFRLTDEVATRLLAISARSVKSEADLISYGLVLSGCKVNGVVAAHRAAAASPTPLQGAACTSPPPAP